MDNDHHSIPHGPSLLKKIGPRHDSRSFSWHPSSVEGGGSPFCFPFSPFIVVSFFLNGVPRVGTCPISFSLQLLGVVVRTKKYGSVKHIVLNAIVAAFPLDIFVFSIVFFCFSTFPALWNDMESCYWWFVASFTLGYTSAEEDSPMAEEGSSLGRAPGSIDTI